MASSSSSAGSPTVEDAKREKREDEEKRDNFLIDEEKTVKIDDENEKYHSVIKQLLLRGYKFAPTDIELITYFLINHISGIPLSSDFIKEIDFYEHDPHQFPVDAFKRSKKQNEAYFFTNLERKYTEGQLPNRTTKNGYWKATGSDVPVIKDQEVVGFKKILVFYSGKAPSGMKTCWVVHEFRVNPSNVPIDASDDSIMAKIESCVVCRIRKKKAEKDQQSSELAEKDQHSSESD